MRTGTPKPSVHRILKDATWKPYIPRLVQTLSENDPDRKVEFCECYLRMRDDIESFPDLMVWSDEVTFKLDGIVNRHNCVHRYSVKP